MKILNNNINLKSHMKIIHLDGKTKKTKNNKNNGIIIKDSNHNTKDLVELKKILKIMITKGRILGIQGLKNAKDNIQINLMKEMVKNGKISRIIIICIKKIKIKKIK